MRIHPRVNSVVFGADWLNRTTNMGENMPQTLFFGSNYGFFFFFLRKTQKPSSEPYISQFIFTVVRHYFPSKMVIPTKKNAAVTSQNTAFFKKKKNCQVRNIQDFISYNKSGIHHCCQRSPLLKSHNSQKLFSPFSLRILLSLKKVFFMIKYSVPNL